MSLYKPRSLTLTVEAKSNDCLKRLLEMALFELEQAEKSFALTSKHDGEVVIFETDGTMGRYKLDYALGSPELVQLRNQLVADGYEFEGKPGFLGNYAVYAHPEGKTPQRLNIDPPSITDHDPETITL